jgi:hypothetical protein
VVWHAGITWSTLVMTIYLTSLGVAIGTSEDDA